MEKALGSRPGYKSSSSYYSTTPAHTAVVFVAWARAQGFLLVARITWKKPWALAQATKAVLRFQQRSERGLLAGCNDSLTQRF